MGSKNAFDINILLAVGDQFCPECPPEPSFLQSPPLSCAIIVIIVSPPPIEWQCFKCKKSEIPLFISIFIFSPEIQNDIFLLEKYEFWVQV